MINNELSDIEIKRLISAADEARKSAYAPYSRFYVGAALLFENDEIITGCNVENGSLGLSTCAERNAMVTSVAKGHNLPVAVAVVGEKGKKCPPCGACRQFLAEFNPDMYVIMEEAGKAVVYKLSELLPLQFSLC